MTWWNPDIFFFKERAEYKLLSVSRRSGRIILKAATGLRYNIEAFVGTVSRQLRALKLDTIHFLVCKSLVSEEPIGLSGNLVHGTNIINQ
jgi:hypothetical protein